MSNTSPEKQWVNRAVNANFTAEAVPLPPLGVLQADLDLAATVVATFSLEGKATPGGAYVRFPLNADMVKGASASVTIDANGDLAIAGAAGNQLAALNIASPMRHMRWNVTDLSGAVGGIATVRYTSTEP